MNNKILNKLIEAGYESYLVGGCVRDQLLDRPVFDIDITTIARPDEIKEVFNDFKTIDIGARFGTIKVLDGADEYEITTFRKESGYADKRHPEKIVYADDIYEDLKRRDFTINALAAVNDEIIDPFDGQADLMAKIIRAVGNPDDRIEEDMLRALRAVRFATTLDFEIESNLKEAIKANASSIVDISKERIQIEINKILLADKPARGIRLLQEVGLLAYIFPEVHRTIDFDQHSTFHPDDLYNHTLSVVDNSPDELEVRMAALYHDVGKVDTFFLDENGEGRFFGHQSLSEELAITRLKDLKYPNKFIEDTAVLIKRHMDNTNTYTKKSIRKLLRNIGEENLLKLFKLQEADVLSTSHKDTSNIDLGREILAEVKADNIPKGRSEIKINGNDLKKLGFSEGKELGRALKIIEEMIYDEKLINNRKEIISFVKTELLNVDTDK